MGRAGLEPHDRAVRPYPRRAGTGIRDNSASDEGSGGRCCAVGCDWLREHVPRQFTNAWGIESLDGSSQPDANAIADSQSIAITFSGGIAIAIARR